MEEGILVKKKDKSAVHEKMWALCIHRNINNQDEWFTFFGDLDKCAEGSAVLFDFEVKERGGKTYRNIRNIEPATPSEQRKKDVKSMMPEKIQKPPGQKVEETTPDSSVELQLLNQGIERIESSISEISARLGSCENMLGSIISCLPGITSKNRQK